MINMDEVRLEAICPPSKGGQHVDNQDKGVKALHLPTGLEAVSKNERSQYRNRVVALAMLEAGISKMKELDR
jgi:protein subunit release factor A